MRHLTFYYAIGFVAVGIVMLCFGILQFAFPPSDNFHAYSITILTAAMALPFAISVLCWLDWQKVQGEAA